MHTAELYYANTIQCGRMHISPSAVTRCTIVFGTVALARVSLMRRAVHFLLGKTLQFEKLLLRN